MPDLCPTIAPSPQHCASLTAYGVAFEIAAETAELFAQLEALLPHGSAAATLGSAKACRFALRSATSGAGYEVLADGRLLDRAASRDQALALLGSRLMIHVAEHAPEYVFVHAGVVAWQDRALLLPAVSRAGKSTLVAELVRAGAVYYSDEFALLDASGRVHPHTRDIRMRAPGSDDQIPLPLARLHGVAGSGPVPVAMVVFAEYAEHSRWMPEAVTPAQAVLEMLRHSIPARRAPERVLATLTAAMRGAVAWRSRRGEASESARALLAGLAAGVPPA